MKEISCVLSIAPVKETSIHPDSATNPPLRSQISLFLFPSSFLILYFIKRSPVDTNVSVRVIPQSISLAPPLPLHADSFDNSLKPQDMLKKFHCPLGKRTHCRRNTGVFAFQAWPIRRNCSFYGRTQLISMTYSTCCKQGPGQNLVGQASQHRAKVV